MRIIVQTQRLCLQVPQPDNWRDIWSWIRDPEIVRYEGKDVPDSEADTRAFVDGMILSSMVVPRISYDLVVVLPHEKNRVIGLVGLHDVNQDERAAWIAYCLDPQYRGRGLATEAVQSLMRYGFEMLQLQQIKAIVHPVNTRSIKVLQRVSMHYLGMRGTDEHIRHVYTTRRAL